MQNSEIGDDSCEHAMDGVCQDGGAKRKDGTGASVFYTDGEGKRVSLCRYATDTHDCGKRILTTVGPLTYAFRGNQPFPANPFPPPLPPHPPPSPPPAGFIACDDSCTAASDPLICSDGGEGAHLRDLGGGSMGFECNYGTQCKACGTRLQVNAISSESYVGSRNGACKST